VAGVCRAVVKQFRNQGLRARLRRRLAGSKATRSWRAAWAVQAAGVETPEPLLLLESRQSDGPSLFVSREVADAFEARYLFRAIHAGREAELFPQVDVDLFLANVGQLARRLHDAGIWHRDLSIGNLLIQDPETTAGKMKIYLLDLNRARLESRLTVFRRCRDLCRLPVLEDRHRDALLRTYWEGRPAGYRFKKGLLIFLQRGFLFKNRFKAAIRAPIRWLKGLLFQRRTYDHIPSPEEGTAAREKAVWDPLSDQPHQHASRAERWRIRMADAGVHGAAALAVARSLPGTVRRYRALQRNLHDRPVPWDGVGVALRPLPGRLDELLGAVEGLGVSRLLLRLHPWQESHDDEEALARALHDRGLELAFALPQNRGLVRNPERWRAAVEELAERFTPFGREFQIGQAINRSKWGVWNYREYLDLATAAAAILRRYPQVEIAGPAVIDFEYQATAAVLNMHAPDLHFDIVSSLLYVDRRGAPENPQLGFDTVDKVVLLKAVAETARNSTGRCWVTEVNWPLREGPHSPAGRSVSVDEETQADYLVRYYLLTLGTGLVERVYWWQLAARGYGLADPLDDGGLRLRPSYRALATLNRMLDGATLIDDGQGGARPTDADATPSTYLRCFREASGADLYVGWTNGPSANIELPRPIDCAFDRDGADLDQSGDTNVEVSVSPRYFRLR